MTQKAVLFDLDNTLYDSRGLVRTARWEACEAMVNSGLRANSVKEAYTRLKEIVERYGSNYDHHYDLLCKAYGISRNPEIVVSGRIAYHNTKFALINPFPNTDHMLMRLVKAGLHLGIVTNGLLDKQWEKILRLKVRHFFDVIVISDKEDTHVGKEGTMKRALAELEIKAERATFVGDNLKTDIASANALGMTTVRFVPLSVSKMEKPKKRVERPDHTIRRTEDLPDVLGL